MEVGSFFNGCSEEVISKTSINRDERMLIFQHFVSSTLLKEEHLQLDAPPSFETLLKVTRFTIAITLDSNPEY
eukprot:1118079-Amphidinium_carterae.1